MPQKPWKETLKPLVPCCCIAPETNTKGKEDIRINTKCYGHGDFGPEIECPTCGKTLSMYYWDNGAIEAEWNKLNKV